MLYTVKYKKPGALFWHKIKKVKGDATYDRDARQFMPYRVLILDDETRVEMPYSLILKFHPNRFRHIHQDMEKAARQSIPIDSRAS